MTTINIAQTAGLPQTTSKFIATNQHEAMHILAASFRIQVVSTLAVSTLLFALAHLFALALKDASLTSYIRVTSFILPFYALFSLYSAGYYNGLHNFRRQAYMNVTYSLAKVVLVIGLVYVWHLYGAIVGFILAPIFALAFGFKMPERVRVEREMYRKLILFSLPLVGFAILSTLLISIDLFFVKALLPAAESAGFYTAGQNIARIPYYALAAFAMMLLPIIAKSISADAVHDTARTIRTTLRQLLFLLVPASLLIALTSPHLLRLLYTSEYVPGAEALAWLALGLACATIFMALANIVTAADRPGLSMLYAGAGVVVTSLACMTLIPKLGLVGASIATLAGSAVAMLGAWVFVARRFPGSVPWLSMGRIAIAGSAVLAVGQVLHLPYAWLPVTYPVLGLVYLGVLVLTRELTRADLELVRGFLPARFGGVRDVS